MGEKKIGECDCCEFSPVELTRYTSQLTREPKEAWYCDLCAGTATSRVAGSSMEYERREVMRTICHVGNAILAAIKSPGTPGT